MIEDQLQNFFDRLYRYCEGFVEIRPLPWTGKRRFFPPGDVDEIEAYFKRLPHLNIHHGIATRDGSAGRMENLVHVPAVWSDVDFRDIRRAALYSKLKNFLCKPTMIIKSGGGVHFYWCLSEPAGVNDFNRIVDVNQRIAACLCGDRKSCDVPHILRPPTTFNLKYQPPRLVELTLVDRFEYDLQYFLDELPEVETRHVSDGGNVNSPGWLFEALRGVPKGSRNATAAKIAGYFVNKLPRKDIEAILLPWGGICRPPMKKKELRQVVNSVYRYKNIGKPNGKEKFRSFFD